MSKREIWRSPKIRKSHLKVHDQRHWGYHEGLNFYLKLRCPDSYWNERLHEHCRERFVWSQSSGHLHFQCGVWHGTEPHVRHEEGRRREIITASSEKNPWGNNLFFIIQHVQLITEAPGSEKYQRSQDPTLCCAVRRRFHTLDSKQDKKKKPAKAKTRQK